MSLLNLIKPFRASEAFARHAFIFPVEVSATRKPRKIDEQDCSDWYVHGTDISHIYGVNL